ncbi:MAG: C40 family peptidase [Deltaproteobacteria bacterium]|jgi:gamma-D-glutamyl-L-lysine dipeptidyl-peptidase|nr:C40 family peptidase [Deltaproteobacteria bacterium]
MFTITDNLKILDKDMSEYAIINVSVSNHYRECFSDTDITTQGVLGEKVEILDRQDTHVYIRQVDNYQSWVSNDQITPAVDLPGRDVMVRKHFMRITAKPSTSSEGVRDAVIGSMLSVVDEQDDWYQLILPDRITGWAKKKHFGDMLSFSVENIISLAREFLGYQYFWGGKTPKGFDCSGFIQTIFYLQGIQISRDANSQQKKQQVSTNYLDAQPGDLVFFSDQPDTVTHVGISLGEEKYIHASGWVKINSFNENDVDYSAKYKAIFTSVNRYRLHEN